MEAEKAAERIRVAPEICSYADDEGKLLSVEITIPGVKRENIELKLQEDSLYLRAPRDDIEFASTLAFCCPVVPDRAEAHYENGILKLAVPFRDEMEHAIRVNIN